MAHEENQTKDLPHDEIKYFEHMKRAADLAKIELFLTARSEYRLALQYRPGDPEATMKAEECTRNITRDRKKVLIVVPIIIAAIILVALLVK
jgi:16S rRNA U1498 N3-methylase RsmE